MESQKAMIKMSIFAELYKFVKPYYTQTFLFLVALVITAGVTLAIGQGLKLVIDEGFNDPSYQRLNEAVFFLVTSSVICLLYTSDASDDVYFVDIGGGRVVE